MRAGYSNWLYPALRLYRDMRQTEPRKPMSAYAVTDRRPLTTGFRSGNVAHVVRANRPKTAVPASAPNGHQMRQTAARATNANRDGLSDNRPENTRQTAAKRGFLHRVVLAAWDVLQSTTTLYRNDDCGNASIPDTNKHGSMRYTGSVAGSGSILLRVSCQI